VAEEQAREKAVREEEEAVKGGNALIVARA
jgi:hypothetical protein